MTWIAARRHPDQSDAGMTLIELLVAMILMGVIGAVVSAGVLSAMQDQRKAQSRLDAVPSAPVRFAQVVEAGYFAISCTSWLVAST